MEFSEGEARYLTPKLLLIITIVLSYNVNEQPGLMPIAHECFNLLFTIPENKWITPIIALVLSFGMLSSIHPNSNVIDLLSRSQILPFP